MLEIERTITTEDVDRIQIRLAAGDASLSSGAGGQIELRARLHSEDESQLEVRKADGELLIAQQPAQSGRNRPLDIFLIVPEQSKLPITVRLGKGNARIEDLDGDQRIETGKGDIAVSGGNGRLAAQTGKGDVAVNGRRGALEIRTGKGDATLHAISGPLRVQSGAGDVSIRDWQAASGNGQDDLLAHCVALGAGDVGLERGQAASLAIRTGRGDIRLAQASIPALEAEVAKGDISASGDPGRGRWRLRASKGDLSVSLPAGAAVRVEAATRRGRIHSDLPQIKVARPGPASQQGGGRTIGVLGEEPRAEIDLETVLGDIRVQAAGAGAGTASVPPPSPEGAPSPSRSNDEGPGRPTALAILESLSQGQISVEEAETLLAGLERA